MGALQGLLHLQGTSTPVALTPAERSTPLREFPDPKPRAARLTRRFPAPPPQRTFEIWSFVFKFVLKRIALNLKWTYWGKYSEEKKKARLVAQAVWLREGLLRLGPTFIKVLRPSARGPPAVLPG